MRRSRVTPGLTLPRVPIQSREFWKIVRICTQHKKIGMRTRQRRGKIYACHVSITVQIITKKQVYSTQKLSSKRRTAMEICLSCMPHRTQAHKHHKNHDILNNATMGITQVYSTQKLSSRRRTAMEICLSCMPHRTQCRNKLHRQLQQPRQLTFCSWYMIASSRLGLSISIISWSSKS